MKIALVLAPWYRRESPSPELVMAASVLRKEGHQVTVYDINNAIFNDSFLLRKYWKYFLLDAPEEARNDFFSEAGGILSQYAEKILSGNPEAVIFKITGKTFPNSERLAKLIKEKDQGKLIIFSGALVSNQEDVDSFVNGQDSLPADYLICGEDEVALPELVKCLSSKSSLTLKRRGKIIDCMMGPIQENLDLLPFYDFSDYDLNTYKFPDRLEMFISRGCPWHCAFCIDWLTEKKYRSMSGKRIAEELQFQARKYRIKHFRFCDKTINGDIAAMEEFCDSMLGIYKDNFPVMEWSGDAMIRPEMTRDLIFKMYTAGCRGLGYGLESGSDKVLKDIGKKFSSALAGEVVRNTHEAGIFTSINIMVGFPTETSVDFEQTLDFIDKNKSFIDEIRLTFIGCRIYKQSILHNQPDKFNLADVDTDFWATRDGVNTYDERVKRYEFICQHILDLGISLRVNSRTTKKVVKAA